MKRIYHHFMDWEEIGAGMWSNVHASEVMGLLAMAVDFTGDAERYGAAMLRVIVEWPLSCQHNLTDININRKAWIGHAAACLAIGCPEHITRMAWGKLSQRQQDAANAKAQEAIDQWTAQHEATNSSLRAAMGTPGLSGRNPGLCAPSVGSAEQGAVLSAHLPGDSTERCGFDLLGLFTPQDGRLHDAQADRAGRAP